MGLWTATDAAAATGGSCPGQWQASRVVIDSRIVQPGDWFVAIEGERFDGHEFVAQALEKGAAAAMVSRPMPKCPSDKLLVVENTLKGLENLARFARARSKAKIVGVTGSVGKTSAKEMLRLALAAHGGVHASSGNFNNHIGLPLNLANLPPEKDFAVFEMGMNHPDEIRPLSKLARPHVAAITNVEAVHLEFFESVEGIARAKAEIFEGVEPGGTAVIGAQANHAEILRQAAQRQGLNVMTFGWKGADCELQDCRAQGGTVVLNGKPYSFHLDAIGQHWLWTACLTLTVAEALGLDIEKTARALQDFSEPAGRGKVMPVTIAGKRIWLIDDSYNASPFSTQAAIEKLEAVWRDKGRRGRKIAALGDMLELGDTAPALHAKLEEPLLRCQADAVYLAGSLMRHLAAALDSKIQTRHLPTAMELLPILQAELQDGDILLVKGSHGSNMHQLARALQQKEGAHAL